MDRTPEHAFAVINDVRGWWTGSEITFEVSRKGDQTEVRFAHLGLVPDFECYDACSNAWGFYINESLRRLITTGEGPTAPPWA